MATIKADKLGRNWILIGAIAAPRTFGPEFGHEERHTPPGDRFYSAAEAYAETVIAAGVFDRLLGGIFAANAERLAADLTARGCRLRVEEETLWVSHPHRLSEEDIAQVEILKPQLMRLVDDSSRLSESLHLCELAGKR